MSIFLKNFIENGKIAEKLQNKNWEISHRQYFFWVCVSIKCDTIRYDASQTNNFLLGRCLIICRCHHCINRTFLLKVHLPSLPLPMYSTKHIYIRHTWYLSCSIQPYCLNRTWTHQSKLKSRRSLVYVMEYASKKKVFSSKTELK